jgi:hypothetical protein
LLVDDPQRPRSKLPGLPPCPGIVHPAGL